MTPAVKAFVKVLIDHFETRISDLESQIQKLTPQNSSLPPSTQHPHAKPKRPKGDGPKRKRGGQKGHQKHHRELIPVEQCDDVIPLQPDACRRCGKPLTGTDPEPIRHQVWELPAPQAHRDGISAAPPGLPVLRNHDLRRAADRCTGRPKRSATGRFYRPADGTLSAKQTAGVAAAARSVEDALRA